MKPVILAVLFLLIAGTVVGGYFLMKKSKTTAVPTTGTTTNIMNPGKYTCTLISTKANVGTVDTTTFPGTEASWACNNWVSACGNGGGCVAQ